MKVPTFRESKSGTTPLDHFVATHEPGGVDTELWRIGLQAVLEQAYRAGWDNRDKFVKPC